MHEDGERLVKLYREKRKSELRGEVAKAEQMKLPKYFITNQVVGDVKLFIENMKFTVIQFYMIVVEEQILSDIEEDLYECLTDLILQGNLQKIVFSFFKLETEDRKKILRNKYNEYLDIQPQHVGIDEKFALNETSPLIQIYEYQMQSQNRINHSLKNNHYNEEILQYSSGSSVFNEMEERKKELSQQYRIQEVKFIL